MSAYPTERFYTYPLDREPEVGDRVVGNAYGNGFPRYLIGEPAHVIRVTRGRVLVTFDSLPGQTPQWIHKSMLQRVTTEREPRT